jgi:serine/threonine protein kinase
VGKFQLVDRLGEGAFAVVYKGRNIETEEIVAVKKMKKMTKTVVVQSFRTPRW